MRAPDFWRCAPASPLAKALAPFGAIYGAIASARMRRKGGRAALPVIVIGGPTLGGDGKTPVALAIAALLAEMGERPFFLTRGYGRHNAQRAPFLVDPGIHDARETGDEALLLARCAPTIVGVDRAAGAALARDLGATALVLDDGLQSRRLEPDLALMVVDGAYGAGNGLCLPAGPLRAPLPRQLAAVDALMLIGEGTAGEAVAEYASAAGKPVLRARIGPLPARLPERVLAFAGIARPEKFFATLEASGVEIVGRKSFADHHRYTAREIAALEREAARLGATLVTTEKDAARLSKDAAARVDALPIRLLLEKEETLRALLRRALTRN
ncbi:lipid-A-disaccharide kinase [Methylosinus sp. sav-2]|uniref:tetraacyldisaccharide 4'-kinase n=1 Tax=Methylosinus sp. sav-2 TaxID=2485168 RepID=UPI00047B2BB4|nr:tetraacyldisaccharide 4'-kinase [Methylosinus sp. sav-2]TDX62177.1 lipid-A-disaccharide kinase [Methylosinus sp. sav-2]